MKTKGNVLCTPKQLAFAEHYALHGNASAAYRHAYNAGNMKPSTVAKRAHELTKNGNVSGMIAVLRDRIKTKAETEFDITAERVLQHYAAIAFANIADYVEWDDGVIRLKPLNELSREQWLAVLKVKSRHGRTNSIEIKIEDKLEALNALARHVGFFGSEPHFKWNEPTC